VVWVASAGGRLGRVAALAGARTAPPRAASPVSRAGAAPGGRRAWWPMPSGLTGATHYEAGPRA